MEMNALTCSISYNSHPIIVPPLPSGLAYELTTIRKTTNITVSGVALHPIGLTKFLVSDGSFSCEFRLGVIGKATYLSYGLDYTVQFVGVPLVPLQPRSNAYLTSYSIRPPLPKGVLFYNETGMIMGVFPDASSSKTTYTVTGTNSVDSIETSIQIVVKESREMTERGFTSCHWLDEFSSIPSGEYFSQNNPTYCQRESKFDFNNHYVGAMVFPWRGLDNRFFFFYASTFVGFFYAPVTGYYIFEIDGDTNLDITVDKWVQSSSDSSGANGPAHRTMLLKEGYHYLLVRYLQVFGGGMLTISFSPQDMPAEKRVIDTSLMFIGGYGPAFLAYPPIRGVVRGDMLYRPSLAAGTADSWFISPSLPPGLYFNPTTGEIRGRPLEPVDADYSVVASAANGASSTRIHIRIDASAQPGVEASYFEYAAQQSSLEICKLPRVLESNRILLEERIDTHIAFPNELPIPYGSVDYVEWKGYLFFSEIGTWRLRLGCAGACRLWSGDRLLVDHWYNLLEEDYGFDVCDDYRSNEVDLSITSIGYVRIRIFFLVDDNKRLQMEWLPPKDAWQEIPPSSFFHVPSDSLSYTHKVSRYTQGIAIASNTPLLQGVSKCANYHASPSLPAGLALDPTSGVISGTPSAEHPEASYDISCVSEAGDLTTTIRFSILKPASEDLKEGSKKSFKEGFNKNLNENLNANLNENASSWLAAEPTQCKGKYENGTVWTNAMMDVDVRSSSLNVRVTKSGHIAQCTMGKYDKEGYAVLSDCSLSLQRRVSHICMPPESLLQLEYSCPVKDGCLVHLTYSDMHWPTLFVFDASGKLPYNKTEMFSADPLPLSRVSLSTSELVAYRGIEISPVSIVPDACYTSITVTPSLGSDFKMDLSNPTIYGYLRGDEKIVYTITAVGRKNQVSATLTVHLKDCNEEGKSNLNMAFFISSFIGGPSYDLYRDAISSENLLIHRDAKVEKTLYKDTLCVEKGFFVVVMNGPYAWPKGSYLKVLNDNERLVEEFSFERGTNTTATQKVGNFTLTSGYAQLSWKFRADAFPGRMWNLLDYKDDAWPETGLGKTHGVWKQNAMYARYAFSLQDAGTYAVVEFGIWCKDGIVAYLNGNEVVRKNMPSGSVDHKTLAIATFDDYFIYPFSAPGYYLKEGKNVLAVEIHRHASTSGELQFRGYVNPIEGSWVSRVYNGAITEPFYFNKLKEASVSAWSSQTERSWTSSSVPVWSVYAFNYGRNEWVNRLALQKGTSLLECNPTFIRLSGSDDGFHWTEVFAHKSPVLFDEGGRKEFMMMNHLQSFSQYKFEVVDCDCERKRMSLLTVDLIASSVNYCLMRDGFPGVMPGGVSSAPCPDGFIGDMYRECRLEDGKPTWSRNDKHECRSNNPPRGFAYVDVSFALTKTDVGKAKNASTVIKAAFASVHGVQASEVDVWRMKDVAMQFDDELVVSAFWVRVTARSKEAPGTLQRVNDSLTPFYQVLNGTYASWFAKDFDLRFYERPVLRVRKVELLSIVLTGFVVLCIVAVVIVWVRKGDKNPIRKRSKGDKKDGLFDPLK